MAVSGSVQEEAVERRMFIGGAWVEAHSGETFEKVNPATGRVIARLAEGGRPDVDRAVASARKAFDEGPWPQMSATERGKILYKIARGIQDNLDVLARLETLDQGKPLHETIGGDIPFGADTFEYYAGAANKVAGQTLPVPPTHLQFSLREPVGVVAAIVPFNYPFVLAVWKVAPALACGNTVVLKPSSETPQSALELARICQEAGLPDGVLNVITGPGTTVGAGLASHPGVDKVAFTGSTEAGREILRAGAETVKNITVELGGKSPMVVFDDADLEQAANGALIAIFRNKGEDCCAGSRLIAQDGIYDRLIERIAEKAQKIRLGDPMDSATQMGPLVSDRQLKRVQSYVDAGRQAGARPVCGGARPGGELAQGYFFSPTVFADADNEMKISREEIFGPVLTAIRFKEEDEAIDVANDTIYGLAASVWSTNVKRALRVVRRVRAGNTWINTHHATFLEAPFGGVKQSGIGKECSMEVLNHYSVIKNVTVDLTPEGPDQFGV